MQVNGLAYKTNYRYPWAGQISYTTHCLLCQSQYPWLLLTGLFWPLESGVNLL